MDVLAYLDKSIATFGADPPANDYQRGHLDALKVARAELSTMTSPSVQPCEVTVSEACPFCGGDGAMPDVCADGYAMVVCVCTAQGPLRMGEAEAIAAWNTRAARPTLAAVEPCEVTEAITGQARDFVATELGWHPDALQQRYGRTIEAGAAIKMVAKALAMNAALPTLNANEMVEADDEFLREIYCRAFDEGAESTIEQWASGPADEPPAMPHKDCKNEGAYQFVEDVRPALASVRPPAGLVGELVGALEELLTCKPSREPEAEDRAQNAIALARSSGLGEGARP